MTAEPHRKKTDSLSFLLGTQPMTSPELLVHYGPPIWLPFSSIKSGSSPFVQWLACSPPWLQTSNCNSLLISNKLLFAGEIFGCFWSILGTQAPINVSTLWVTKFSDHIQESAWPLSIVKFSLEKVHIWDLVRVAFMFFYVFEICNIKIGKSERWFHRLKVFHFF